MILFWMACDISHIFQTHVSALRQTNDWCNEGTLETELEAVSAQPKCSSMFTTRGYGLLDNLTALAEYLKRVRQLTSGSVTNKFKQQIHQELTEQVTTLIGHCTVLLDQLNNLVDLDDSGTCLADDCIQIRQHRKAICDHLADELSRLKQKRDIEENRRRQLSELTGSLSSGVRSIMQARNNVTSLGDTNSDQTELRQRHSATSMQSTELNESRHSTADEPSLSANEIQRFEVENRVMFQQLHSQREDVDRVARAISEIGRLNQTLSMHLSDQLEVTQQIGANLTTTTEEVLQGNQLLRKALSTKASIQFWILFTLIVLTFSIHFLDWYYP